MKRTTIFLFLLLIYGYTSNTQTIWKLDMAHSKVMFSISHMVISEVTGRFKDFDATLEQINDDFSNSNLKAVIKVKSIDTDNEGRDKHLLSPDFFNVEKFPEITFVSKKFEKVGKDAYNVTGDFTMHGVVKEISLSVKFNGTMVDPWGNTRAGFKATTKINRKDFGIQWNKTLETGGLLVGEDVDILINVEMQKEKK